jgi:hypothetical protein
MTDTTQTGRSREDWVRGVRGSTQEDTEVRLLGFYSIRYRITRERGEDKKPTLHLAGKEAQLYLSGLVVVPGSVVFGAGMYAGARSVGMQHQRKAVLGRMGGFGSGVWGLFSYYLLCRYDVRADASYREAYIGPKA